MQRQPLSIATKILALGVLVYIVTWTATGLLVRSGLVTIVGTLADVPIRHWLQLANLTVAVSATMVAMRLWLQPEGRLLRRITRRWANQVAEKNRVIARTHHELEVLVQDLAILYEIGQGVNSTIELQELFQVICHLLPKRVGIQEFAILLLDHEHQRLQMKAAWGFPHLERIQNMSFAMGEGVTGLVAATGRLMYIKDVSKESRYLHYRGEHQRTGSFLSIPLHYKGDFIGVMNCGRTEVDGFSRNEIKLLQLVANQIALAIANARLYAKTRELSVRDELTGLYNRRHFLHVMQLEWKRATRFRRSLSILMIDADHFKRYNDTYGHSDGDRVLKKMGGLLHKALREVDTLARYGGEEFVVLLPDTDRSGAMAVGEKLRRIIESEPFILADGESHPVTISVGVSSYPDDVKELEDLIDHADIALYDAKDHGRNRVVGYAATTPANTSPESVEEQTPAPPVRTIN